MSGAVVIIGGGVVGLWVALHSRRRGFRVTVLERGGPPVFDPLDLGAAGCSLGNAGLIVPSHFVPLAAPGAVASGLRALFDRSGPIGMPMLPRPEFLRWARLFARSATEAHVLRAGPLLRDLHLASLRGYEELAERTGNAFGLTKSGLLLLCRTDEALHHEAEQAKQAQALGLEARVLSRPEAARADSGTRVEAVGAVFYPGDAYLDPRRLMAELARVAEAEGVELRWGMGVDVFGFNTREDRIGAVITMFEEIAADEFVVAGGAWSSRLLRPLGIRLPLEGGKGYSITLPRPTKRPSIPALLVEERIAVTPMGDDLRFTGCMEFSGLDRSINERRVRRMRASIAAYLPEFTEDRLRDLPVWSGLRPCSPDGMPYVGRWPGLRNLTVATGHAMMGVSTAPATGEMAAAILSGEPPPFEAELLAPDRFA